MKNRQEEPLTCPLCGSGMHPVFREGRVLFWGCDEFRGSTGCRGRRYPDPENLAAPLPYVCPECHQGLCRRTGRNGRIYTACFEKEKHKGGAVLFFNDDGTPEEPVPRAKGQWDCPSCGSPLKYIRVRSGPHAGSMVFACFEREKHGDGRALFFQDADGIPILSVGPEADGEKNHA